MSKIKEDFHLEFNDYYDSFSSKQPEDILKNYIIYLTAKDVRGILKKSMTNRTQDDISELYFYFKKIDFFNEIQQTYDLSTMLSCLKVLSLVSFKPNQKVFQKGEISNNFWILLNGEAIISDDLKNENKQFNVGDYVGNFDDHMMQFSLKTVLKCEFAMIRKEQYEHVVQKRDENQLKRMIKLLMNTTIFEDFQTVILKKYINLFEKRIYQFNNIIYDENQPIDGIYIIDCGQFMILKSKIIDDSKSQNDSNLPQNKTFVRLSVLQQQCQVFGQEEIFRAQSQRRNRVICCMNNSKVFFLSFQHYSEMSKSTSNKTISNLVYKEKNSQYMRDYIVQARNQLDEVYKNFLYQSNTPSPFHNYKKFDQSTLDEIQQLQVPSTIRTNQLFQSPANIQQVLSSSINNLSPAKNHIIQEGLQQIEKHQNSPNKQNYAGITPSIIRKQNNISINQSNINNSFTFHSQNSYSIIQLSSGVNSSFVKNSGNIINTQILSNTMTTNNDLINQSQIGNYPTENISMINQNSMQIEKNEFIEENDILAIHQRQKLQNIQEILEKNKHLQQNLNFINDEDILLALQRNKSNSVACNLIQNKIKENILKKKQNFLKKQSNSFQRQKTQEFKNEEISQLNDSIYRKRSFYYENNVKQNNQNIYIRKDSIFQQKINRSLIYNDKRNRDLESLLPSQYLKEDKISTNSKFIQEDNNTQKNNSLIQILEQRRQSQSQNLSMERSRKSKQQSFQNIYNSQDINNDQTSQQNQICKLNQSEDFSANKHICNIQKNNKTEQQVNFDTQKFHEKFKKRYNINKSQDLQSKYGPIRDFIPKQILNGNSYEKIKEDNPNKIYKQDELITNIENDILQAVSGPKNKIIENYIDKYIKRTYKIKMRSGSGISILQDQNLQENSVHIQNEQQFNDGQQIKSNDHISSKQKTLPFIENSSNYKSFLGGIQPQNSINKQFLRKSRNKIKQKFHKAIDDKQLLDSPVNSRFHTPIKQEFSKDANQNRVDNTSVFINKQFSPNTIKNTPKLHKILLGIE